MHCIFKEVKLVDAEGNLNLQKLAGHLDLLSTEAAKIATSMGKACLTPQGNTPCEKAYWYHKCWKTNDPKVHIYMQLDIISQIILYCNN